MISFLKRYLSQPHDWVDSQGNKPASPGLIAYVRVVKPIAVGCTVAKSSEWTIVHAPGECRRDGALVVIFWETAAGAFLGLPYGRAALRLVFFVDFGITLGVL